MTSNRCHNTNIQKIARFALAWFLFFVVLVPAFHRHASSFSATAAQITAKNAASHSGTGSFAYKIPVASVDGDDDCPICQWFSVGFFTPALPIHVLTLAAVSALLALTVRLLALCQRPLPRRGLRAPPVFAS